MLTHDWKKLKRKWEKKGNAPSQNTTLRQPRVSEKLSLPNEIQGIQGVQKMKRPNSDSFELGDGGSCCTMQLLGDISILIKLIIFFENALIGLGLSR